MTSETMAGRHNDVSAECKPEEGNGAQLVPINKRVILETEGNRWLKLLSLVLLTPHYAVLILLMRYVRTRPGAMFVTSTTVVMSEVAKTLSCFVIIFFQQKGPRGCLGHLQEYLIGRPGDFAKVCLPSFLFVIQNNLVFVAISNLDAATFQVTYQLKILTTAIFSVVMLGKKLSTSQWVALLMLFAGVAIIQAESAMAKAKPNPAAAAATSSSRYSRSINHPHPDPHPNPNPQSPPTVAYSSLTKDQQNHLTGVLAVLSCCLLSGFANVFFEVLLKGGKQSVWLRNVQLGLSGSVLGAVACLAHDGQKVLDQGFFHGYDSLVWAVVLLQSSGGLLVAAVIKYADNILKGFSTAGSILLSCLASVYFFNFQIHSMFVLGTSLVLVAVYLYSHYPPVTPGLELDVKPPHGPSSPEKTRNHV